MLPQSRFDQMRTRHAEIDIEAPQALIWRILVDLEHYAEWNPFTYGYSGTLGVGEPFVFKVRMNAALKLDAPEVFHLIEPPNRIAWRGAYPHWLVAATRYQVLTPLTPTRTHYHTWETFRGGLGLVVVTLFGRDVERGFQAMAAALKARAEAMYAIGR